MTYPGGKNGAGVFQTLINLMPPHRVYIEPFLGSGAVLRLKRPAERNIGVDLDPESLNAAREYSIAENGERRRRPSPEITRGSAGGIAAIGETGSPSYEFLVGDGIKFLRSYPWTGEELVYCDPPYLKSTRSSKRDLYRCEMSALQHRHFLRVSIALPCRVMISGYWSQMYADALEGWNVETFQAMTRGGRPATEHVWFNFARPVELHDYRYLGRGFRERERIKRKKTRWVSRLERMPVLERQALLAAIASSQSRGQE